MNTFDTRIQGIPCQVEVLHFKKIPRWPGSAETAPSDVDFYGYSELTYRVLDRKGYVAEWLERKMTHADFERVEREAVDYMS